MKTKSHGTAFAYPVAPLMWKSGTRHVSMARATYLARPIAMSSCGDSFPVKKFILTPFSQIRCPLASEKPDDVEGAPGMIAASFKAMVDSSDLDRAMAENPSSFRNAGTGGGGRAKAGL